MRSLDNPDTLVVVEFSTIKQAEDMARLAIEIFDLNTNAVGMVSVSGFDKDPRELDDIPEAVAMLAAVGKVFGWKYLVRMEPIATGLVLLSGAMGESMAKRNGYDIVISPEAMDHLAKALRGWQY